MNRPRPEVLLEAQRFLNEMFSTTERMEWEQATQFVVIIHDTETDQDEFVGPFTGDDALFDALRYAQQREDSFNSIEPDEPPLAARIEILWTPEQKSTA